MDLKGLVDKAKAALRSNPSLIDKGGDAIDKATGGKYADKVNKAQDAARKAVGSDQQNRGGNIPGQPGGQQPGPGQPGPGQPGPGQPGPGQQPGPAR
ncbi:hypothetical protein GCM10009624_17950 [Gordonia sinesedis]